jgi:chromosomal replication initiator protein
VSAELDDIWSRVQRELALSVDELTYRIWLAPLKPHEVEGTQLLVGAPRQTRAWLRDRFGRLLDACAANALGPGATVAFVDARGFIDTPRANAALSPPAEAPRDTARRRERGGQATGGPERICAPLTNPKLTFDQFVIGDSNRLAHAAALTVAELPATAYNPLFICGPPGVGKTHLLSSIATLVHEHNPALTVRCTTGESFTNEFLNSLKNSVEPFKARFRDVDVLLVDDVQFLERKAKTEEEFFHTFNALHDGGRQIVLTSDRPPHDLRALEDRLRERFACGLVADIHPPDLATRLAILRKRAHHDGVAIADERAILVIAERVDDNVRALEGALIRVVAFSSLTGRPLDERLANEVLDSLYPHDHARTRAICSPAAIQAVVSDYFDVSADELRSPSRVVRVAWPRQLAMYLTRELTGESLPSIGRAFGGRDHTTVLYACRRTTERLGNDREARSAVERLCESLGVPQPQVDHITPDR